MATGGGDDGLDLSELESERHGLHEDELATTNDSLLWEEHKAQFEYQKLEAESSGELEFSRFHTPVASPTKNCSNKSESAVNLNVSSTPTTPHVHVVFDSNSKSAPTSPSPN